MFKLILLYGIRKEKAYLLKIKENSQEKEVKKIYFSPNGKYLISGVFDNKIKKHDILNNFILSSELEYNDKVIRFKLNPYLFIIELR